MYEHYHVRLYLKPGQVVINELDRSARVMLMSDGNYANYRNNRRCTIHGGWAKVSPAPIKPPRSGYWNLVLDLEGRAGNFKHSYWIADS